MLQEKAFIYLRVSTEIQDEENQLSATTKYCQDKNWQISHIYRDHGLSAYKENVVRPEFEAMLEACKRREAQHIVVFDLDRFSRQDEEIVVDQVTQLNMMYGVQVNAVFGDEWKDTIELLNKLPSMGYVGKAIVEMLRSLFLGMQAHKARQESIKISRRVIHSLKFQKAKKEQRVGRPKIPPIIVLIIKELLNYYSSYEDIKPQLYYKEGKEIKYPSEAFVSLVRTGVINIIEENGKHVYIDRRKESKTPTM